MLFIQQTYAAEKPLAGLCYGHQIIARALGGRTSRNPGGWELSVCEVNLTPKGMGLFGVNSLVEHFLPERRMILTMTRISTKCTETQSLKPQIKSKSSHPALAAMSRSCTSLVEFWDSKGTPSLTSLFQNLLSFRGWTMAFWIGHCMKMR